MNVQAVKPTVQKCTSWQGQVHHQKTHQWRKVAMEVDDAMVDPEFDTVHAWMPRDRVITKRMEDYLVR